MDVFSLRSQVVNDYASYVRSFVKIREENLKDYVNQKLDDQSLWPQPLIQLNPSFQPGGWIDALVDQEVIHEECRKIFRVKKDDDIIGKPMRLHKHQVDAIHAANSNGNYVLTTGTGSGKSLSYIIPIVDHVLRTGRGQGVKAIVVYPMNALCNSQYGELEKFLTLGYGEGNEPVRFEKYTGQESDEKRDFIRQNPPDILLTNYVMLELLLTRPFERQLVAAANNLRFLVLDELHTYRGRQGADVAMLTRRVRESCQATNMLCVGTSATMASGGSYDEQRAEIASVTTRLFGSEFLPANVIGETLTRATDEIDFTEQANVDRLRGDINSTDIPTDHSKFIASAMSSWLETNFGLEWDDESNRHKRATPQAITGPEGAVRDLESLTGLPEEICETAVRRWLLAGYDCDPHPESGLRPFAFRLHQFISRGDTVFASLESENDRTISLSGQQYAPGSNKSKLFMPLAFCRECGAEYYTVRRQIDSQTERVRFRSRTLSENLDDPEEGEAGFLYRDSKNPWPEDPQDVFDRLPEDWLEVVRDSIRIRANLRSEVPVPVDLSETGEIEDGGLRFWYTRAPFRFCQNCGVSYRTRRRSSDFGQLATLASGGRSSATTMLSLSSVRFLKAEDSLEAHAKKFLSFTDNRQDASLQAGHLNDFVEVSLLRAALYKAAVNAGEDGIDHDELAQKVFKSLGLSLDHYAREPGVQFAQKADTEKAFRNVIGYRVYRDLKRGWRVTSPNLEQCGLITVDYPSLDELCNSESHWFGTHAALVAASPATRESICRTLLDHMRRELAIDVDYLTYEFFERLQQQSSQRLREPWAIDEQEKAEIATMIYPTGSYQVRECPDSARVLYQRLDDAGFANDHGSRFDCARLS